jgi:hypothetical protein
MQVFPESEGLLLENGAEKFHARVRGKRDVEIRGILRERGLADGRPGLQVVARLHIENLSGLAIDSN